jgi:hypothetical protein
MRLVVRARGERGRERGKGKPLASVSSLACAVSWDTSKKVVTMTPRKKRDLTAMPTLINIFLKFWSVNTVALPRAARFL